MLSILCWPDFAINIEKHPHRYKATIQQAGEGDCMGSGYYLQYWADMSMKAPSKQSSAAHRLGLMRDPRIKAAFQQISRVHQY